jgi:hypothetical protein
MKLQEVSFAEQVALNQHINALNTIKGALAPFSNKVVNKRLVDAIKATGIYVGWADDYAGRKEMTHYSNTKGNVYPQYYREIKIPLVLENCRLQLEETITAINELNVVLDQKYDDYAFDQAEYSERYTRIAELMAQVDKIASEVPNSHARYELQQRARRGY